MTLMTHPAPPTISRRDLHDGRAFPPLRGGIKGGVTRVQMLRRAGVSSPALPTLIPTPLAREAGRDLHDGRVRSMPTQTTKERV